MQTNSKIKLILVALSLLFFSASATSEEKSSPFKRVGGTYMVTTIDKVEKNTFIIEFKSTSPSGRFDYLRLESDHINVAVKIGQKIRLSAEILSIEGDTAEVSQVLMFLPTKRGRMPVWLLSKKARGMPLKAAKYLEMHAPMTDYTIL